MNNCTLTAVYADDAPSLFTVTITLVNGMNAVQKVAVDATGITP